MRPLIPLVLLSLLAGCAANDAPAGDDGAAGPGGNETPDDAMPVEAEAIQVVVGEGGAGVPPQLYFLMPTPLELVAGKAYNLTLKNEGRLPHDLVIEGLDVAIPSTPGGQASEGVTFTPLAGTYAMYCTIGQGSPTAHKDHGMAGEVVVA